jgi:hypothetical protein
MSQPNKPNLLMIFAGLAIVGLCTLSVQLFRQRQIAKAGNLELDNALEDTFPASDPVNTY